MKVTFCVPSYGPLYERLKNNSDAIKIVPFTKEAACKEISRKKMSWYNPFSLLRIGLYQFRFLGFLKNLNGYTGQF